MIYDLLAPFYDKINADINYAQWADFIEAIVDKHGIRKPELWLDLGCGTGRMTLELASRGRDMTGIDYSPEMLDIARNEAERLEIDSVLWLCQDMREFELYGTVDVAISCLDSINHLTSKKDLDKCLKLVHNYLAPDGLFIFDMNTPYKFYHIYGNNSYILEDENVLCAWQNEFDEQTKKCTFFISLFEKQKGNQYARYDSEQVESCFSLSDIQAAWQEAGFVLEALHGDIFEAPVSDTTERWHFVLRAIKP